jgi:hypothetical protein
MAEGDEFLRATARLPAAGAGRRDRDLAESFVGGEEGSALFLRAERRDDGKRTVRLLEGEPLPTSYGPDLYRQVFTTEPPAAAASPQVGERSGRQAILA